jgi:hypothetical protein
MIGTAIALPLAYVTQGHLHGLPQVLAVQAGGYLAYLAAAFFVAYSAPERTKIRQATFRLLARA